MKLYRIVYGQPWITIFHHEWGDLALIFMSDEVTSENHWWIASQAWRLFLSQVRWFAMIFILWHSHELNRCWIVSWVTKNSAFTVTHTLFHFLHAILWPDWAHKTAWHCDVTTVQSVISHVYEVLALWRHIHQLFLHMQIWAWVIFTSE